MQGYLSLTVGSSIEIDLMTNNIRVGDFGEFLVMDWGLAKKWDETPISELDLAIDPGTENFAETLQGDVMGKPHSMNQNRHQVISLNSINDLVSSP